MKNTRGKGRFLHQDIMKGEWKPRERERERERSMNNAIAGGGTWRAMSLGTDGKTERGSEEEAGISIFDPVLCEIVYRWFCPPSGTVLDPFAGGSVRGIVASKLGLDYVGLDLREEQNEANRKQAATICGDCSPTWHTADSREMDSFVQGLLADLVFSCPPYADLEIYSDIPADISTMPYPEFRDAYIDIIGKACAHLRDNRFACFVVGEARGNDGNYYGLVPDTIQAFRAAGLSYYNEAILITSAGSLPIRAARPFVSSRKLGKTHQNILIFVKGDPKKAADACGAVDVSFHDDPPAS